MIWKQRKLAEFCKTGSGSTPSRAKANEYYGGTIPWVKSGELKEQIILDTEEKVTEKALAETAIKIVPKGALLIAMYGATVGRMAFLGRAATTNQAVCHIIADPSVCEKRYLFYYLQGIIPQLLDRRVGGGQPNISQQIIKNLKIPLPSLPEQKRTAAILDKANAICHKRRQAIKVADEFLHAIFLDMFGNPVANSKAWKQRKFSDVCIINPKPEKNVKFDRSSFVSFVPMACVDEKRGQIMNSEKKTYAEVAKGYTFFKNSDVLMAKITPCMENGKAAIAENLINGLGFGSTEFHVLRPQSEVTSEYIFSFIHREPFRLEAKSRFTGTAGQQRVPTSFLKDYEIPVPPIDLQNKFSTFFKKIRKIRQKSELLIDKNADLFSSLTQKAFRGEL